MQLIFSLILKQASLVQTNSNLFPLALAVLGRCYKEDSIILRLVALPRLSFNQSVDFKGASFEAYKSDIDFELSICIGLMVIYGNRFIL